MERYIGVWTGKFIIAKMQISSNKLKRQCNHNKKFRMSSELYQIPLA